jgi:DNA recombination protein RmuC
MIAVAIASLLAGIVLTAVILRIKSRSDAAALIQENLGLKENLAQLGSRLQASEAVRDDNVRLKEDLSSLRTRLEMERKHTAEKLELLQGARDQLTLQFKTLASEIFDEKGKRFRETSEKEIKALLNPFQERIQEFKKQVSDSYETEVRERASLKEQITQLARLNQQISQEAENLTNALKGQTKTQGAWGEMILETVLEQSGLRKGEEYEIQVSMESEEKRRLRPDAVVHIPGNRDVIIDAKVSLKAYEEFCSADTDEERQKSLAEHMRSVRNHIKILRDKDYSALPDLKTVDFVLMFVPIEGAFSLAVQGDNRLFTEAFQNRIVLVSPSTLFATLRTIENSWRFEKQTQNAQEIARRAGALYEKFVGFVEDLEKVGNYLDMGKKSYDSALGKLSQGKGNLIRRAEDLKDLGAQTGKKLPDNLLND